MQHEYDRRKNLFGQPEEKRKFKRRNLRQEIILKWVSGIELEAVEWNNFLRIWSTGRLC
jgi:hypothetical protein